VGGGKKNSSHNTTTSREGIKKGESKQGEPGLPDSRNRRDASELVHVSAIGQAVGLSCGAIRPGRGTPTGIPKRR